MPRSPLTNEEILRKIRFDEENHHRRCREYFFHARPLTLPVCLPIPQVDLEHIQDSCNKSTAIYSITPHLEGHTEAYNRDGANRSDIIFSIYEQWFRHHSLDIDFGGFVAKLLRIEIPSTEQRPTVQDIIKIHKAWCEHVETCLPLCARRIDSTGTEIEDSPYEWHGAIGINRKQNMYYKLRPLFRALIIIVDEHATPRQEKVVHLIRTNIPSELSAPITFESIRPNLESDKSLGPDNKDLITTTLSAAIDFVTALEKREESAFPENRRDPNIVDERGNEPGHHTRKARLYMGYTGPGIRGPSSSWVKLAEGENVLPPLTPAVLSMRCSRIKMDMAVFARYQQSEQRLKYRVGYLSAEPGVAQ